MDLFEMSMSTLRVSLPHPGSCHCHHAVTPVSGPHWGHSTRARVPAEGAKSLKGSSALILTSRACPSCLGLKSTKLSPLKPGHCSLSCQATRSTLFTISVIPCSTYTYQISRSSFVRMKIGSGSFCETRAKHLHRHISTFETCLPVQ